MQKPPNRQPSWSLPAALGLAAAALLIACLAVTTLVARPLLERRGALATIQTPGATEQVTAVVADRTPAPSSVPTELPTQVPEITPSPTDTPLPSDTPVPTDTTTPTPTATPTRTPTRTPTATPEPTETRTPTPSPTPTSSLPDIEYFRISPQTVAAGECALLEWGAVNNAFEAIIDQEIGGVATPGSLSVCPTTTTTYVLTANGLGGTVTSSVTVSVLTTGPNLTIESITFVPDPPVRGQENEIRITIRNQGGGDAGPFSWEWQAGFMTPIAGRLPDGLKAGQSTVEAVTWQPDDAQEMIQVVARADINAEVAEADETDNELRVNRQISQSSLGDLVLQEFYLHFDDQVLLRVSNPDGRIAAPRFDFHLYEDGVLADSGSFDTPALGSMVFWTGYVVEGERRIRVVIDPNNLIAESDETNNEGTLTCSSASHSCQ